MSAEDHLVFVPYAEDPLQALAELLLARHRTQLPDLSRNIVILSQAQGAARLRALLLRTLQHHGHDAVLPPFIGTLQQWFDTRASGAPPVTERQREALLLAALRDHPYLDARPVRWPFIDSLLQLFDELNLAEQDDIADEERLRGKLERGYGTGPAGLEPLSREARVVDGLWRAWRGHLAENGVEDATAGLQRALRELVDDRRPGEEIYLVGPVSLAREEVFHFRRLLDEGRLTIIFHGQTGNSSGYHPDTPVSLLARRFGAPLPARTRKSSACETLDAIFSAEGPDLRQRADEIRRRHPESALRDTIKIFDASDAEDEARAIELQVRRWLLDGKREIGIVTQDRKLARRLRALLERAGVQIRDAGGWPLSTTSAATAVMRWLETIEQDFNPAVFLDLLQSPFVLPTIDPARKKELVGRLRAGVLVAVTGPATPERYQAVLREQTGVLASRYGEDTVSALRDILAQVHTAALKLRALRTSGAQPAVACLEALRESLARLGVTDGYREDEAGALVEAEIEQLGSVARSHDLHMHWDEFRDWIAHSFERRLFTPRIRPSGVQLLGFAQSRLQRFDALVIAGCAEDQLPGAARATPFFNDRVRAELGLTTARDTRTQLYYDFRRLLESAGRVLITWRREDAGQPLLASPWVELLQGFHALAYGGALVAHDLRALLAHPQTTVAVRDRSLPAASCFPAVKVPAALVPTRISASSHQRLIDCPYRYFAADCLRLREAEDVEMELSKADYGQRVHAALHAFHAGTPGLPGPFRGSLAADRRAEAEELLVSISRAVFRPDIERSFLAKGWLARWLELIPDYIAWQSRREADWRFEAAESEHLRPLPDLDLELHGRVDRIDVGAAGCSIVDYKTGTLPKLDDILGGESVQLPLYANLVGGQLAVAEVLLLGLGDGITDKVRLEGEPLAALARQTLARAAALAAAIRNGTAMPARGDEATCEFCEAESLCRKEMWSTTPV